MALQLEHHDGSQRLLRAVVRSLRFGWERLQLPFTYHRHELSLYLLACGVPLGTHQINQLLPVPWVR